MFGLKKPEATYQSFGSGLHTEVRSQEVAVPAVDGERPILPTGELIKQVEVKVLRQWATTYKVEAPERVYRKKASYWNQPDKEEILIDVEEFHNIKGGVK